MGGALATVCGCNGNRKSRLTEDMCCRLLQCLVHAWRVKLASEVHLVNSM